MEFIYNSCVFILTCLNFSHHQSTPHLMQCTYWDVSSAAQNGFWTRGFWCLLVLLLFFVSLLLYWENISLWGFFHEENKIVAQGQIGWIGRKGGAWTSCHFWSKTTEHSAWCGQVCSQISHHEMGKCGERVFKKKFSQTQPLTTPPSGIWYR